MGSVLLLISCTSIPKKTTEAPVLYFPEVPSVYSPDGEPLIFYDEETHTVSMDENKWNEFVVYIVETEEAKSVLKELQLIK